VFKGAIKTISEYVDVKVFGGQVKSRDVIGVHEHAQIKDCLHYRSFDDEKMIFYNEDSVGVVFEMCPLLGVDEKNFNMFYQLVSRSVPDHLNLQIMTYSSPKVGALLDVYGDKKFAPTSIYSTVAKHRTKHFEKGVWKGLSKRSPFFLRNYRTIISASINISDNSDAESLVIEYGELLESTIKQLSPDYKRYGPRQLICLLDDLLNPNKNVRPSYVRYDPNEDINEQIISPDTRYSREKTGIRISTSGIVNELSNGPIAFREYENQEFVSRTLEARFFPKHLAFGDMSRAIGDVFAINSRHTAPIVMSLNVYYPPQGDANALAQIKHIRAVNNAKTPISAWMPEMKRKADDWNYVSDLLAQGSRMVNVRFQCTVTAEASEIEKAERNTRNLLTGMNFEMRRGDLVHFPALMFGLPMGSGSVFGKDMRRLNRMKPLQSDMIPHASPIFGEFLGSNSPVLLLAGRCGQPYFWDNFSNVGMGNHNLMVVAESGGGKSVLLNDTAFGTCANGGHSIVFDDGESFKNHCLLVGGNHYSFSLNDEFGLNVFDMIDYLKAERDAEYKSTCIEMCKAVIIQMVFGENKPSKEESAILEEAILSVMNKYGSEGNIDAIQEFLEEIDDSRLESNTKSMAKSITTYTSKGVFGSFFNGKNTLDVSRHMTVFELSPLESKPDLRSVILTALLFMVDQKMVSNTARRDLVIIDEAHKHIENANVCNVIQGWARRLRKYNAAVLLATQSATDFSISNDSQAIFENCGWKIMLQSSDAGVEAANQMNVFPDAYSKRCAKNAAVSMGEYSEAVIIGGGTYSLGRVAMDPFSIKLFTTTAAEVTEIRQLERQGYSLEQAIYRVSGVEPINDNKIYEAA